MNPYGMDGNLHALDRHLRDMDQKYADDDWLEEEEERIYASPIELGEACFDAPADMKISEAVALEAQRRLELMRESRDEI
jgi:hypothetical protein